MDTDLSIPGLDDDYGEQITSSNKFLEMDLATPTTNPINGDVFYTEAVKKFHEIPGIETTPDFMEKAHAPPPKMYQGYRTVWQALGTLTVVNERRSRYSKKRPKIKLACSKPRTH
eukprot:scaffold3013_cov113-Isochrysis_galbana.AAC.3